MWHPLKLAKQVDYLDRHAEVGLIYNWVAIIDSASNPTGRIMGGTIAGKVFAEILQRNIIDCTSVLVRRQCFDRVGLFDRSLRSVEDWDMWIRIANHYAFAVTQEPLVYYRQHSGNMSKNWSVMEQAFLQVIDKSFESVPSKLQYLKNNSLGYANLCVAWKVLQSQDADRQLARKFQKQAIANYPKLRHSANNLRLSIAIAALQWIGADAYNKLLAIVFAMRRRISGITS